jgi:hypothetical protein
MSVPKSLSLAAIVVLGLSTMAYAASRTQARYPRTSSYSNYTNPPAAGGGGWSSDPHTRYLQELAAKYPGSGY